jgi:hypothetical protein
MRLPILAALALIALGASTAGAATADRQPPLLTGREAALAVREEVGANWALLETARRGPPGQATFKVECMGIAPRRRLSSWEARNKERGQHAEGLASVRAAPGGAVARLYAYRCVARAGLGCI